MFTFIETRLFTRIVSDYFSDDEYGVLQVRLAADPELGALIPESTGRRHLDADHLCQERNRDDHPEGPREDQE